MQHYYDDINYEESDNIDYLEIVEVLELAYFPWGILQLYYFG